MLTVFVIVICTIFVIALVSMTWHNYINEPAQIKNPCAPNEEPFTFTYSDPQKGQLTTITCVQRRTQ